MNQLSHSMTKDHGQILLQDEEVQNLLKEMILQKADRYDEVLQEILSEKEIDDILRAQITVNSLHKILDTEIAKEEVTLLKRDLSAMCYQLNKSRNKVANDTKWEGAYEYATQVAQIADVVANLLGIINFNKNINCPFHEDKSPSLKIYTKNNRFVCFGCGARGSPVDFVMKNKNCSFQEAVLYLSNS